MANFDDEMFLFGGLSQNNLHQELFPKLKELCEILEKYLKHFEESWKPNVTTLLSYLEELEKRCLKVKKDVRIAKIVGSSVTLGSALCLIGLGIATIVLPPLGIAGMVAGGVGLAAGLGGTATHITSSLVERSSDKDIVEKVKAALNKHMENKKNLNDIMVEFETKYNSILEYFNGLGLNGQVLSSSVRLADCETFKILKIYQAKFKSKYSKTQNKLEKSSGDKRVYIEAIKALAGFIKRIFEKLVSHTWAFNIKMADLMRKIKVPPGVIGFLDDGANVLGVASKVGLGIGIAFNVVGVGVSIFDIVTEAIKDCNKDQLVIEIKSIREALKSEDEVFQKHKEDIVESKNNIEKMTDYV